MAQWPFWYLNYCSRLNFIPKLSKSLFRSSNFSIRSNFILQLWKWSFQSL